MSSTAESFHAGKHSADNLLDGLAKLYEVMTYNRLRADAQTCLGPLIITCMATTSKLKCPAFRASDHDPRLKAVVGTQDRNLTEALKKHELGYQNPLGTLLAVTLVSLASKDTENFSARCTVDQALTYFKNNPTLVTPAKLNEACRKIFNEVQGKNYSAGTKLEAEEASKIMQMILDVALPCAAPKTKEELEAELEAEKARTSGVVGAVSSTLAGAATTVSSWFPSLWSTASGTPAPDAGEASVPARTPGAGAGAGSGK